MFDLFRSRDKAVRIVLTILLGLVALSMVAYLIPGGPGGPTMASGDNVLAEIGDEKVTMVEVQRTLQGALRGKQFPPEMLQNYVPELINQMISERAVAYQAARMGLTVTEDELGNAIRSMLGNILQGGFNKEVYAGFLAQQNLTISDFESNVRKQMLMTKLLNIVMEGIVVTPEEAEAEFRRRNERAKIDYVSVNTDQLRSQVTITPEEVQQFFNASRGNFRIPEKRTFEVLVASEEKIGASIVPTDDDLRKAYNSNMDRYRSGERVKVRHILLMTTEKPAEEVKKLEAKAGELLKQIKAGADFAELAKKNSDDPGSASKGGDLDWVVKGQTVPEFENTAFSLKKGDISNVIKTQYGFHIVQVLEREEARVKPFEEVKTELATETKQRVVFERMQSAADQARAALAKSPNSSAQIAEQFNLNHYTVQNASAGDPIQEIGVNPEFEAAVSGLDKGGVTAVITAPGNKLAFAVLTGAAPARNAELAEVEQQVKDQLTSHKARQMLQAKQAEAARVVASANGDLAKVAQALGGTVRTSAEFGRDGMVEGVGNANYFADAFTKPIGTVFGPVNIMEQVIVAKVASRTEADMSKLATERDELVTALKGRKARERKDLFEDGIVTKLVDQGKIKINQDAIKRLQNSYRG